MGAPEPGAPPCMRHTFFPLTAGARHGSPDRVRAPQRGLASIGPVFRRWCRGSGAICSPVSSTLVPSRIKSPFGAGGRPGQNRRSPSAGRSNDRPGAPTAIAVVSSRSSEPNSVRHRQARLIHLRVKTIQADQNPSWWAATLHRVVFSKLDFLIKYLIDFPRSVLKNFDCCLA